MQPWLRGCPSRAAGGFPGQGWSELPEPWVGGGTRGNSRLSWPGGWSSLTLQAGERGNAAQPCSGSVHVAACLHRLLFPVAIFLVLHCSYIKPNQQFYFHFLPRFLGWKWSLPCLAGKQKLGLCRAAAKEEGDGDQLQTPLVAPPPLNSHSFHQHVSNCASSRWIKYITTNQYCPEAQMHFLELIHFPAQPFPEGWARSWHSSQVPTCCLAACQPHHWS